MNEPAFYPNTASAPSSWQTWAKNTTVENWTHKKFKCNFLREVKIKNPSI